MNSRQKKILSLVVNNFLLLGVDVLSTIRYKKGKISKEGLITGRITRTMATTANSLGILYLEEQERQEKRQKHNESKSLSIAKDFSHTLNKTKGAK